MLAATIEHLGNSENIKRLGHAFKAYNFAPTSLLSESAADSVLDTYMSAFILGEDLFELNVAQILELKIQLLILTSLCAQRARTWNLKPVQSRNPLVALTFH